MAEADNEEKAYIARAKQGDLAAFEQLVLRYEKMVYTLAFRMMDHSEDAKDLSQEVFLKAYRSIARFDERAAFSTWLYRIAMNACIDEMRRRKGKQTLSIEQEQESEDGSMQHQIADPGDTPEESLLRQEKRSEILEALGQLSAEHRAVVILRDVKELRYEEIAEILQLPPGTVKSRLSRARRQLKAEILKIRERNAENARHRKGREGR